MNYASYTRDSTINYTFFAKPLWLIAFFRSRYINKGIMAKREYVEANKRWLEEKAKEEGVQVLP